MHYAIEDLDGLGEVLRARLARAGIRTTRHLIQRGGAPEDRAALSRVLGVAIDQVEAALSLADLLRVKGVGQGYAALLMTAGVRSVAALREAEASALLPALAAAKPAAKGRRLPTENDVAGWIADARGLEIVVR